MRNKQNDDYGYNKKKVLIIMMTDIIMIIDQ